ncbi:uncharacterized protein METZ01_LOCUS396386, partial [marine metagenome]
MQIKNKKFLIIGGAGLIGSHTTDLLIKEGAKKIIIFDNFTRGKKSNLNNALKNKNVEIFPLGGDILQIDILNNAMKEVDGVFHFAALWLMHCHEFPRSAFNTNVLGAYNVFESCINNKVDKLVFSSSASVYGDAEYNPINEKHPFNNKNFYGATKISGEALLNALHHRYGIKYIGLRYMNVYGERQDQKGAYVAVIMKIIDSIFNNISPVIYGKGDEAFDFINVKDCAAANILAMKSNINNGFYNVGTGKKTKLIDLATLL